MFRQAVLLSIAAGMICAQDAKRCTIEGTITDARSGAPIPNATLILSQTAGGQPKVFDSVSDATGKFTLKDLVPGGYNLVATTGGHSRRTVSINCSPPVTTINFVLPSEGVISGSVMDDEGRPVQRARITLLLLFYLGGEKRFVSVGESMADNQGQFRLDNLPEGTYYLQAAAPDSGKKPSDRVNVPTFYPSALESYGAAPVRIRGPGEMSGTDIRLRKARAFSVSGSLLAGAVAENVRDFFVRLIPADLRTPGPRFTIRDEKGHFDFPGVVPGSYTLIACKIGSRNSIARSRVEIVDRDVEDVELVLDAGNRVTGIVSSDDKDSGAPPPGIRIDLLSWENLPVFSSEIATGTGFTLANTPAAIYRVAVSRSSRWFAKALRVDGRDILDWIADLTAPQPHTLEIVLGADAGRITGYARDGSGNPRPKTLMTLVPGGNGPLTTPQYATTVSDDQGRYVFTGVQPGAYKVFAWEKVDPGLVQNRQVLSQFESQCADVEVAPNGSANGDVTVITASATAILE
jgi:hypothetical protein